MHVFRHARVPTACLKLEEGTAPTPANLALEPWVECDIAVEGHRIVSVQASASEASTPVNGTDLGGALVFPGMLDAHTHLDKTHTWHRAPNPRGEFWDAIEVLHRDAVANWTADDIYARAHFALASAWAHGTNALRTHIDSSAKLGDVAHGVAQQLRREWAGKIELQTVSLCNLSNFAGGEAARIVELTAKHHATVMGGFPQPNPYLAAQLDYLIDAATELGIGLDLHVDESGLNHAECLRATAQAVLRKEFPHPVTCGHNCSLSVHGDAHAEETIRLVKEAGINIISLPLCNLYLQGRKWDAAGQPLAPQWRGLTRVHEFMAAGVTVACASDNVRDAFYAWGDYDMLEVFSESVRLAHLDTRLATGVGVVTTGPAKIMGLPGYGQIVPGSPADLIVSEAPTFNQFFARPLAPRRIIFGETFRDSTPPSWDDLSPRYAYRA